MVRLTETDFSGLNKLELLLLHSNGIHTIPAKTFSDLQALQVRPPWGGMGSRGEIDLKSVLLVDVNTSLTLILKCCFYEMKKKEKRK